MEKLGTGSTEKCLRQLGPYKWFRDYFTLSYYIGTTRESFHAWVGKFLTEGKKHLM